MSYTMTMDMPQKAAVYVNKSPQLRRELSAIVLAVVNARMQSVVRMRRSARTKDESSAMAQWDCLVKAGKGRLAKPYRFSRADAYDEELG